MSKELTVIKKHTYYRIREDFGILKKGMQCYCYAHDENNIVLYFSRPLISDVHEVKLSRKSAHILEPI